MFADQFFKYFYQETSKIMARFIWNYRIQIFLPKKIYLITLKYWLITGNKYFCKKRSAFAKMLFRYLRSANIQTYKT